MSVINFSKEENNKLVQMMAYHHDYIIELLRDNAKYTKDFLELGSNSSQEALIVNLLYYSFLANKFAFIAQYKEDFNYKNEVADFKYDKKETLECTLEELRDELSHLHYNLFTNGGTAFLEQKWLGPLEYLVDNLIPIPKQTKSKTWSF